MPGRLPGGVDDVGEQDGAETFGCHRTQRVVASDELEQDFPFANVDIKIRPAIRSGCDAAYTIDGGPP